MQYNTVETLFNNTEIVCQKKNVLNIGLLFTEQIQYCETVQFFTNKTLLILFLSPVPYLTFFETFKILWAKLTIDCHR